LKNNLPTEAGQTKPSSATEQAAAQNARIDALNECFTLFGINYHNQFLKAYSSQEKLNTAKRLWFDALKDQTPETILKAAKSVINASEFLPTLKTMLDHCEQVSGLSFPAPHNAFQEACLAPSPKLEFNWSHPIVFFAGKDTGWHFLQQNPESQTYPVFKEHYKSLCEKARSGVVYKLPEVKKLEEKEKIPASEDTQERYLSSLKGLFE